MSVVSLVTKCLLAKFLLTKYLFSYACWPNVVKQMSVGQMSVNSKNCWPNVFFYKCLYGKSLLAKCLLIKMTVG